MMSGAPPPSGGESKPLQDNNSKQTGNTLMNQSQTSEKKSGFFQKIAASVLPRSLTGEVYLPDDKDKSVPDPVFRDAVTPNPKRTTTRDNSQKLYHIDKFEKLGNWFSRTIKKLFDFCFVK